MPATMAWADTEYGSELKSVRISGTASSGTGGTGSGQATGAGNTHGYGRASQPPSGRTPPHGPMTMRLGQPWPAARPAGPGSAAKRPLDAPGRLPELAPDVLAELPRTAADPVGQSRTGGPANKQGHDQPRP
jgi:hypothetical protein